MKLATFNFALGVLVSLLLWSCNTTKSTNDFSALKVKWRLVSNNVAENPTSTCQFIFINQGKNMIESKDWTMDFNQITFFKESKGDTSIGKIVHVNGYLNRFTPGNKFIIKPSDSLIYEYTSPNPIIKAAHAPRGAYIVNDDKAIAIAPIDFSGFEDLNRVFPDSTIYSTVPNALNTYEKNHFINSHGTSGAKCPIIPSPNMYSENGERFILNNENKLYFNEAFANEGSYLQSFLKNQLGIHLQINNTNQKQDNGINLVYDAEIKGKENYILEIRNAVITINASSPSGMFYGIQSLLQLIPTQYYQEKSLAIEIAGATIKDGPRFEYRGFLLDVARNFQTKESLFKLIDLLSLYKINKLNLRLTEDEGWRLEIEDLPELTQVGSKRGHTLNSKDHLQPAFGSGPFPSKSQDYYTKKDFVEIIKYAAQRHVEIIPEICFPSHARAAIMSMEARYDKYMKEGNPTKAEEFRLIDPEDKSIYMSAQGFKDNIVSVARPSTYHFYETVVKSILQMYKEAGVPLKTFNTGGDEVPYGAWSQSPMAQKLIQSLPEIKDPIQLQGYFLEKVIEMLSNYHLQISGWEEIVLNKNPNGVPVVNTKFVNKNVLPLVWDNTGGNIDLGNRIANKGYPIILCNVTNLYLDLAYNTDPFETGLYWGGFTNNIDPYLMTPMNVYHSTNYNFWGDLTKNTPSFPSKEKLNADAIQNIKGLQAQLWTETVTEGESMMEYFILPKLFGFAERAWSRAPEWEENNNTQQRVNGIYKGWANFTKIIGLHHLPRLDYLNGGYNYRISPPGAKILDGSVTVNCEFPGLIVRYTTDGSEPNKNSTIFPAKLVKSNSLKVRAFNSLGNSSKTFLVQ